MEHFSKILFRKKNIKLYCKSAHINNVVYMLHPAGGSRRSWLFNAESVIKKHENTLFVFPESGRRWFINDKDNNCYEDYLIEELIPFVERKMKLENIARSIGGFSMGGASALFLSLRHIGTFDSVFSFAGAFYAARRQGDPYALDRDENCMMPTENEHYMVWGELGSKTRLQYDPDNIIQHAVSPYPKIYIETGSNDWGRIIDMNRSMNKLLKEKEIPHSYGEFDGGHDWNYAKQALSRYLSKFCI